MAVVAFRFGGERMTTGVDGADDTAPRSGDIRGSQLARWLTTRFPSEASVWWHCCVAPPRSAGRSARLAAPSWPLARRTPRPEIAYQR